MPETTDRYGTLPGDAAAAFADQLREFDRRLSELERGGAAGNSQVLTDPTTGKVILASGRNPETGNYGLYVANANGRVVQELTTDGFIKPYQAIPMFPNGGASIGGAFRPGTTSPAFFELWRGDFWATAPNVYFDIVVYPNGGNMDWRWLCYEVGGTPTVTSFGNGETVNTQRGGQFTIPAAGLLDNPEQGPVGRAVTVRLEARRNSGAAQVDIAVAGPPLNRL